MARARMRIAVVTTSYPSWEGDPAGHFVRTEVRALEADGHHVTVVRPAAGGAFGWPGVAARVKERPLRALAAAAWVAKARAELAAARPDRVVAHWCLPCAYPVARRARGRAELEIVSHGGDVRLLVALPAAVRRTVMASLLGARRWRFVSAELRATLVASLDEAQAQRLLALSEVVPGAIDVPDVRAEIAAKRLAVGGRRLYVCAGRLVPSKRIDKVIDYVATSGDRDARTLVVLGDGPQRPQLERVANAWRFDVRFLGTRPRREALGWIGAADELVHASRVEGLSTVVREASALGVPVTFVG